MTERVPSLAEATAVQQVDSHSYSANFLPEWCIGSVPHGGVVASTMLRVARVHFETTLARQKQPHTMTYHMSFLNRTQTGAALFRVEDVKLGRQTSVIHVTLTQDGRKEVVAYITQTNFDTQEGVSVKTSWALTPAPPAIDFGLLAAKRDPHWALLEYSPFKRFRAATNRCEMVLPRKGVTDAGCLDEWLRLATTTASGEAERFSDVSLGYVGDMFPQPIEAVNVPETYVPPGNADLEQQRKGTASFWYPTVLMNLEVKKALPAEGVEWLYQRIQVKQIAKGRYDLDTVILDAAGDVVATSTHVALAVPASRNTSARRKQDASL